MSRRCWRNSATAIPLFPPAGAQPAGAGAAYVNRQRDFYTPGGLPRAERELAATVASKINGCIYCASVHARKAAQLAKDETAVETLLAVTPGENLSDGQTPGWQAQIDFAAAISVTPPALAAGHLAAVEQQGLDTLAQLDLLQSAAFFAWANRLMLTLGEPWQE
jgi:uncharacterized peroxidase-related enzyme